MSRPLLAALLSLGLALPLAAQSSAEMRARQDAELARMERTRDSLLVLWREARDLEALQDSLAHAASVGRLDTIDIGAIRIITNRSKLPLREAAEAYWPVLDSLYGDEAQQLRQHPLVLQAIRPDTGRRRDWVAVGVGLGQRAEYWGSPVDERTDVEGLINIFRANLNVGAPDSAIRVWLPGAVYPPIFGLTTEARDAYIGLVTSRFQVSQRCLEGDLPSCKVALRLDDRNPEELLKAFTTGEQRYLVQMMEGVFRHNRNLSGLAECRAGSDTACGELLRSAAPAQLPQPLLSESHKLLVHLALQRGGRDAYRRLIADSTASLAMRIESSAGIPIDSLIAAWRTAVVAARPEPVSLPAGEALATLGWVVLMGYFGLRSSRWRLG